MAQVRVALSDVDCDAAWLERSTAALRRELLDLDVQDVVPTSMGEAPKDARAIDVVEIGNLLVTVAQTSDALRQLAEAVSQWIARDAGRCQAELVINGDRLTVTGIDVETQDRLIEAWLQAHGLDRAGDED